MVGGWEEDGMGMGEDVGDAGGGVIFNCENWGGCK